MVNARSHKISLKEIRRRYLNLKGILSGRHAYKGPDIVQIDLTDKCDSHCLVCWSHSPLLEGLGKKNMGELDHGRMRNFVDDVAKSGVKEIIFSGGGEPFQCSHIWETLEFIEKKGLKFRINTNFTLLGDVEIRKLASLKNLLSLTVSIWAGNADLYSKIHHRSPCVFDKVKNNLKLLHDLKSSFLQVRIYAVITKVNYLELRSLLNLAFETGCGEAEFSVSDVIPHVTDSFLPTPDQLRFLKKDIIEIRKELKRKHSKVKIVNDEIFLKRLSNAKAYLGEYDSAVENMPCYAGWFFLRLRANGDFNSCLKSHRLPIGNIYNNDFSSVWNNPLQQEFRVKALNVPKDRRYFALMGNCTDQGIGCNRLCDNRLVNEHLHKILKHLF